jgi:uncharacterized protein YxeA
MFYTHGQKITWLDITLLLFVSILCSAIIIYQTKILREISFDNSSVYIKSLFSHEEEIIKYSDIIELRETFKNIPTFGIGGKKFLLKYNSNNKIKKVQFYGSFDLREINSFKRKISPDLLK